MTVIVRLPPQLAAIVAERAKALGMDQDQYVLHIIHRAVFDGPR